MIYALHKRFGGFPRLPYPNPKSISINQQTEETYNQNIKSIRDELLAIAIARSNTLNLNKLPVDFKRNFSHENMQIQASADCILNTIKGEFGLDDHRSLCRLAASVLECTFAFGYKEGLSRIWEKKIVFSKESLEMQTQLPQEISLTPTVAKLIIENLMESDLSVSALDGPIEILIEHWPHYDRKLLQFFRTLIEHVSYPDSFSRKSAHYLPASRSGIMQSYKLVASSIVEQFQNRNSSNARASSALSRITLDLIKKSC